MRYLLDTDICVFWLRGQASAETAANYLHARIQSVSIGNSSGNKNLTIVLRGPDALV